MRDQLKIYLFKKIRLHHREYTWTDSGVLIRNYGTIFIYLILKIINPATSIGVSNRKGKIEKSTLSKFGNNIKDLLCDMSSNYSIIIDKGECYYDYLRHIFRDILKGKTKL